MSEIINFKQIYNITIEDKITDLFLNNNNLMNIKNQNGTIYETPIIGYSTWNYTGGLCFFNHFNDALKGTKEKIINRYAIFLGFMKLNNKSNNIPYFYSSNKYKQNKYNSVYDVINPDHILNYLIEINDDNSYILLSGFEK